MILNNNDEIMRKAWDKVAKSYQDRYDLQTKRIHYGPLCPSEDKLQLLGDLNDKVVLELGAGAGQNAIVVAKSGARVTAIDISREQISHGRKLAKSADAKVNYKVGSFLDFCDMGYKNEFDIVLSVYALQYCYDVAEMEKVFKSIYKSIKSGGRFVFSLDHPIRAHGYWFKDSFMIDNYFDRDQKEWVYKFPETKIATDMSGSFKTLGDYFMSLIKAGFEVKQIIEPQPIIKDDNSNFGVKSSYGTNSPDDPFSFNHLNRIPGTLVFQAFKLR